MRCTYKKVLFTFLNSLFNVTRFELIYNGDESKGLEKRNTSLS